MMNKEGAKPSLLCVLQSKEQLGVDVVPLRATPVRTRLAKVQRRPSLVGAVAGLRSVGFAVRTAREHPLLGSGVCRGLCVPSALPMAVGALAVHQL